MANYASMLEEKEYYEDAFGAYERGVALFHWPHVRELWFGYLTAFHARYGGTKLERSRDLYEQALRKAPAADAATLLVDYAKLEEAHGLGRRAMAVYERAALAADDERAFGAWRLYAAKVERAYGAPKARGVYERAVKALNVDDDAKKMCLAFAALERGLGEVDRARAILAHGAQFADPRLDDHYWQTWRDFEVQHGNEDTFREMLRVKRSVETARSSAVYVADGLLKTDAPLMSDAEAERRMAGDAPASKKRSADEGGAAETEMAALERQAARIVEATSQKAPARASSRAPARRRRPNRRHQDRSRSGPPPVLSMWLRRCARLGVPARPSRSRRRRLPPHYASWTRAGCRPSVARLRRRT